MKKVKCIDDKASFNSLRNGNIYDVINESIGSIRINSDRGERTFSKNRFVEV